MSRVNRLRELWENELLNKDAVCPYLLNFVEKLEKDNALLREVAKAAKDNMYVPEEMFSPGVCCCCGSPSYEKHDKDCELNNTIEAAEEALEVSDE